MVQLLKPRQFRRQHSAAHKTTTLAVSNAAPSLTLIPGSKVTCNAVREVSFTDPYLSRPKGPFVFCEIDKTDSNSLNPPQHLAFSDSMNTQLEFF